MHGQITYETRTLYRSRCFCGWKSDETENALEANLAYDEHVAPFRERQEAREALLAEIREAL